MATNTAACAITNPVNFIDGPKLKQQRPRVDVAALLRESVSAHGAHKSVALELDYKPDYWTRVLSCERGITLDRFSRLPYAVQVDLVVGWADALGLKVNRRKDRGSRAQALAALMSAITALTEDE